MNSIGSGALNPTSLIESEQSANYFTVIESFVKEYDLNINCVTSHFKQNVKEYPSVFVFEAKISNDGDWSRTTFD